MKITATLLTALLSLAAAATQAQMPFSHPAIATGAVKTEASLLAREASPVLVGHPASPRWALVHANQEHPAVAQARLARAGAIDPNTFLVQPPAPVQWTLGPAADAKTALAAQ